VTEENSSCGIRQPDYSAIEVISMDSSSGLRSESLDYQLAMQKADEIAEEKLEDYMLLSWYDRDRDFESPQHASECHADSAVPGYVDYGIHHGACLKIDFEQGRFVFFYRSF
jgi:hypothetical protein